MQPVKYLKTSHRIRPWVTKDVLDLCEERRDLMKKQDEAVGAKEYKEANKKAVKKAKEDWIDAQCEEIETGLNKNNSIIAYQLVKDITSEIQGRSSIIQDKRFSADRQNVAQNCTTVRVVVTTQYWTTAVSPRRKICNVSSVRKLSLQ